jgi:transposase
MFITLSRWRRRRPNTTGSRTAPQPFLTDAQWNLIKDLFENPDPSPEGGRPRCDARACFEGVIWVLRHGARWKELPERYPSPATCWRRHRDWTESGKLTAAWTRLLQNLDRRKRLHWDQSIADGTFASAKKGVPRLATRNAGKGQRSCCSWTVVVCPSLR